MTSKKQTTHARSLALTVLIPVYNEENTILEILQGVTALPIENYEVLIVDDASRDSSLKIIEKFEKSFKHPNVAIKVLSHPKNRGKGAGIKTGLDHARGKYFVIQDADLEYNPKDITGMLEVAFSNNYPVVYGSRFLGDIKGMPKPNYYANHFYNFLLRRLYPTAISDMHTCYKMVLTDVLKDFNLASEGFGYATELVSKLLRAGYEILEVPISFNGRNKKEGKKINFHDGIECTVNLLLFRFKPKLGQKGQSNETT